MTARESPLAAGAAHHVPALDGVRGLAICMVFLYHVPLGLPAISGFPDLKYPLHLFSLFWSGVDVFYVLSGFLITNILIATRDSDGYLRRFYVRRVLRIFPLFYTTLLLYFGLGGVLGALGAGEQHGQLWYWLYLQNWVQALDALPQPALSHYWSLAIEEQFYLVWPLALFLVRSKKVGLRVCAGIVVATLVARVVLCAQGASTQFLHFATVTRADSLAWGGLLAFSGYVVEREQLERWGRLGLVVAPTGVLAAAACHPRSPLWGNPVMQTLGYTMLGGTVVALIAVAVLRPSSFFARQLSRPSLRLLGKYSYGVYVFHWPVIRVASKYFREWTPSPFLGVTYVVTVVFMTAILSWLSWTLVEAPMLSLKRYF